MHWLISVIFAISAYFENKDAPIIYYQYNKPIPSPVLNYDTLVTGLDIETTVPDS